jgi:hypothetical protein
LYAGYEDYLYSEGNEEKGHVPLTDILDTVAKVVACGQGTNEAIEFTCPVRPYTDEEYEEEGKGGGCDWFKQDDEARALADILIGFDS